MKLGAHMSIAGGVFQALKMGVNVGCETIQIFTKNNNRWEGKPLTEDEIKEFFRLKDQSGIDPVFAHDAYLINLASPREDILQKSINAMIDEVERAAKLKLPYLVMHPGSHTGSGEKIGLRTVSESLRYVIEKTSQCSVRILVETTAGQGSNLGYRFEHIAEILEGVRDEERIGVCLDTCHIFAAGYDIRTKEKYEETMKEFNSIIGIKKLFALHLNDSKKELGSRVDRHAHIGQGFIGKNAFGFLLNDERLKHLPAVLETPKNKNCDEDRINLALLRSLIKLQSL